MSPKHRPDCQPTSPLRAARHLVVVLGLFAIGACVGEVDGDSGRIDDTGGDGDEPEPEPEPEPVPLRGTVMNFTDLAPVADAAISSAEISYAGVSAVDGTYETAPLDAGIVLGITATLSPSHRITTNPMVMSADDLGEVPTYVMTLGEDVRQVDAVDVVRIVGSSVVVAELLRGDGTPRDGVPLADISLLNRDGLEVGDGPYVVGLNNLADPGPELTEIIDGSARVMFLNVPKGELTLSALYPIDEDGGGGGGEPLKTTTLTTTDSSAVLLRLNDTSVAPGGGGGSP